MTTKEYLNKIDRLRVMIENKLVEVDQLKEMTYGLTCSTGTDKERVKSSGSQDRMGDSVAKLVDIERELENMIDDYTKQRMNIIAQIESLEETIYYNVLFKRYVCGKDFKDIARETNYSLRSITDIHKEALQCFEEKYGSLYKDSVC